MFSKIKMIVIVGVFVFFAQIGSAQIELSLTMKQKEYLQYEPVMVEVLIINNSGRQLLFGATKFGNISFTIFDPSGNLVPPIKKNFNPAEGLILESGQKKKLTLQLNKYYSLQKLGKFKVSLVLTHPALNSKFLTESQKITVIGGLIKATKNFGVTASAGSGQVFSRTYQIIAFNKTNGHLYYLKIFDKNWVYSIKKLGPKVDGIEIMHDIDAFSNIHILIQVRPKIFRYYIINPNGKIKQVRYFKGTKESVPYLYREPGIGRIMILEGVEMEKNTDYILK